MAYVRTIKNKDGSKTYRAEYCVTRNGKKERSTENLPVESLSEAKKLADEIEATMKAALRVGGSGLTAEWWQNQADGIMKLLGYGPVFRVESSVGVLARSWLESKEKTAKATLARYKQHVEMWQKDEAFWNSPVTLIKRTDIERVLSEFGKGRTVSTTKVMRASLNGLFKLAVDLELIEKNPVHKAATGQGEQGGGFERQPFSFEDVLKLRVFFEDSENAKAVGLSVGEFEDWRIMMEMSLRGAVRISDNSNLKSEDLEWVGEVLFLNYQAEKTGRKVSLPCSDLFAGLVAGREGFLCPSLAGRQQNGRVGLSAVWIRIQEAAGVSCARVKTTSGKMMSTKSFHSFRHTCPSWMLAAGVPKEMVIEVTGHANEKILDAHYVHQIREAMGKIKTDMDEFEKVHLRSV